MHHRIRHSYGLLFIISIIISSSISSSDLTSASKRNQIDLRNDICHYIVDSAMLAIFVTYQLSPAHCVDARDTALSILTSVWATAIMLPHLLRGVSNKKVEDSKTQRDNLTYGIVAIDAMNIAAALYYLGTEDIMRHEFLDSKDTCWGSIARLGYIYLLAHDIYNRLKK